MTQPSLARSPAPQGAWQSRDRGLELDRNEVTDIIPFNEFGNLDDLDFSDSVRNTFELVLCVVPLQLLAALGMSMMLR